MKTSGYFMKSLILTFSAFVMWLFKQIYVAIPKGTSDDWWPLYGYIIPNLFILVVLVFAAGFAFAAVIHYVLERVHVHVTVEPEPKRD